MILQQLGTCFKMVAERREPSGFAWVSFDFVLPEGLRPAAYVGILNYKTRSYISLLIRRC